MPGETPVEIVNPDAQTPLLIICDHASNRVPAALDNLGLSADMLARHIGWDIGAAAVTRRLACALDATAILARTSRLVIDPNRDPADPTSIPEISDRIRIPANCDLSAIERARRHAAYFLPYHDAIEREIQRLRAHCTAPSIFSVHSFTPRCRARNARCISACCGTGIRAWPLSCSNRCARMPMGSSSAITSPIRASSSPTRSTAMAAAMACPIAPSKPSGSGGRRAVRRALGRDRRTGTPDHPGKPRIASRPHY